MMKVLGNHIITFLIFGAFMYYILPMLRKGMTTYERLLKTVWGALVFTVVKALLDYFLPDF